LNCSCQRKSISFTNKFVLRKVQETPYRNFAGQQSSRRRSGLDGIVNKARAGRCGVRIPYEKQEFSFPKRYDQLLGPSSLLFSGYWGSFLGVKRPTRNLTTHLRLAQRSIMSVTTPLLSYNPSWRG
jgi:hypothetical protein